MRLKIFQIDADKDKNNAMFMCYDATLKKNSFIDTELYKTVFDGDVECDDPEKVFMLFNDNAPPAFQGHSLSVSDIIEIGGSDCIEPGTYFCDSVGFRKLDDFDTSKVEPIKGNRMLILEPMKSPYEAVVGDSLEALQQSVAGCIEITYLFDDNAFVVGNGEAKLIGLQGNRHIGGSVYAGTLLIAADDGEGGTKSLTDEQIAKYSEMFAEPEEISDEEVQDNIGFFFIGLN